MADLEDMPEPFLPTRTVISKRTLLGNLSTAVVLAAHSDQRGAPTDRGEGRVGAPAAPPAGDALLVLGKGPCRRRYAGLGQRPVSTKPRPTGGDRGSIPASTAARGARDSGPQGAAM